MEKMLLGIAAMQDFSYLTKWLEKIIPTVAGFVLEITLAIVVLFVGSKIIRWVRKVLRTYLEKCEADKGVMQFLDSLVKYGLYLILILAVLQRFGIQTTSIVAAIGSMGVAVGLALKGSLSNFASGVIILVLKPFVVGDYIVQGSLEGTVKEIQLFYTTLVTGDNRQIIIPNGQLTDNSVINVTSSETRRLDIIVGISYQSDMKTAKNLLLEIGNSVEEAIREEGKEPMSAVESLGESAVNMLLRLWVPTGQYAALKFQLNEEIKNAFDQAGIEIPYNQLDVHVISENKTNEN